MRPSSLDSTNIRTALCWMLSYNTWTFYWFSPGFIWFRSCLQLLRVLMIMVTMNRNLIKRTIYSVMCHSVVCVCVSFCAFLCVCALSVPLSPDLQQLWVIDHSYFHWLIRTWSVKTWRSERAVPGETQDRAERKHTYTTVHIENTVFISDLPFLFFF